MASLSCQVLLKELTTSLNTTSYSWITKWNFRTTTNSSRRGWRTWNCTSRWKMVTFPTWFHTRIGTTLMGAFWRIKAPLRSANSSFHSLSRGIALTKQAKSELSKVLLSQAMAMRAISTTRSSKAQEAKVTRSLYKYLSLLKFLTSPSLA